MRHRVGGFKLQRNTSHRRALLRNLVTSLIMEERIETTITKAKAMRPLVEKMITLGKRGDLSARRQASAYLMTRESVVRLFDTVAPRFGDRNGGYSRIVRTGFRQGDGGEKAFIELLGNEKFLEKKRKKSAEARTKRAEETRKQLEADQKAIEAEAEKVKGDKEEK
jgi:large subunit ribosomal protein L17